MTAVLDRPAPAAGRSNSSRAGVALVVDGACRLQTATRPAYRVAVDTAGRRVDVRDGDLALAFACQAASDGGDPPHPSTCFGWTATASDGDGGLHVVPVRCGQVFIACLQDRDAAEALRAVTLAVVAEAERMATGCSAGEAATAAARAEARQAWLRRARGLRAGLEQAEQLRRVPVRPLRDAFLARQAAGQLTATGMARKLGWLWPARERRAAHGDSARVLRRLGLTHDPADDRRSQRWLAATPGERELLDALDPLTATVAYDTAVALCRAMDMAPAEFGWL